MIWTSTRPWAPKFVVTVQSNPSYLIEISLFCIVAAILCAAVFVISRKPSWAFSELHALLGDGSTPAALAVTGSSLDDAREAAAAAGDRDVNYLPAGEGAGDGDAAWAGWPWLDDARGEVDLPGAPSTVDVVHVLCAACHQAHRGRQDGGVVASPTSDTMREVDADAEELTLSVDDDEDESLSSSSSLVDAEGVEVDVAVGAEREDDEQGGEDNIANALQGGMVEFVAARYRGFKEAALAGRLLLVDPAAPPLLSESGLVAILSHALKAPLAKRRGFPGPEQKRGWDAE